MIKYELENERVLIVTRQTTTLAELAMGLNFAVQWMLGHGVHRLRIERPYNLQSHGCNLEVKALIPAKPLTFSPVAKMRELVRDDYFPRYIPKGQQFKTDDTKVGDGQNQIAATDDSGTVLRSGGDYGTSSIVEMAYIVADIAVWAFTVGSEAFEWHGSLEMYETWLNVILDEQETLRAITPQGVAYNAMRTVATLR